MAAEAVASWLQQDWRDRELVILDDSNRPSFPDGIIGPGIKYEAAAGGSIGWKRNRCCELASGEWIAHWDDDDWSHPARLAHQMGIAMASGAPVVGYRQMEFRDLHTGERWLYKASSDRYALGTSLIYRRWFWERCRFVEVNHLPDGTLIPEDAAFVAAAGRCIVTDPGQGMMWASIHPSNTSPRHTGGALWSKIA
jgi:O-antigen biosynthesis protein